MSKYRVEFNGDLEVEAESQEKAICAAIEQIKQDPDNTLFFDVEELRVCRFCGCTDDHACDGGCSWVEGVEGDVCSAAACVAKLQAEQVAAGE
jgi:hypothetical protein